MKVRQQTGVHRQDMECLGLRAGGRSREHSRPEQDRVRPKEDIYNGENEIKNELVVTRGTYSGE